MKDTNEREDYRKVGGELKGKAKLSNFWYYYKWHTIAAIFVVAIAAITITECVNRVDPDVSINLVVEKALTAEPLDFQTRFGEQITDVDGDGNQKVLFNQLYVAAEPKDEQSMAMMQKVDLEFAAGDNNLYLFDQTNYDRYSTRDAFQPMEDMLDLSAVPEEKKVYGREEGPNQGKVVALNLKGSSVLREMGVSEEADVYVAFQFLQDKKKSNEEYMARYENAKLIVQELLK